MQTDRRRGPSSLLKPRLLLFGASGHAKVVCDVIARQGVFDLVGIVDPRLIPGDLFAGTRVLGTDEDAPQIAARTVATHAFVAVGDNGIRARITGEVRERIPGVAFATLVHPSAVVAEGASLGTGIVVMAGAIINSDAVAEEGCIINTSASVDHDVHLGKYSSVGPGVSLGGKVRVGDGSAVAIGATVLHGIAIGAHTVVGAGSVVTRDLPPGVVAYGVPARVIRQRASGDPYL